MPCSAQLRRDLLRDRERQLLLVRGRRRRPARRGSSRRGRDRARRPASAATRTASGRQPAASSARTPHASSSCGSRDACARRRQPSFAAVLDPTVRNATVFDSWRAAAHLRALRSRRSSCSSSRRPRGRDQPRVIGSVPTRACRAGRAPARRRAADLARRARLPRAVPVLLRRHARRGARRRARGAAAARARHARPGRARGAARRRACSPRSRSSRACPTLSLPLELAFGACAIAIVVARVRRASATSASQIGIVRRRGAAADRTPSTALGARFLWPDSVALDGPIADARARRRDGAVRRRRSSRRTCSRRARSRAR